MAMPSAAPLVGAAGPVQGMLTRRRDYRSLAWRTLVGQGLGTLAGISSAMAGAGAWSCPLNATARRIRAIVCRGKAVALAMFISWFPPIRGYKASVGRIDRSPASVL